MSETPIVTVVADFAASGDFEKKHTPYLTAVAQGDKTLVTVEVGHDVPHPNGTDHYITFIELYAGTAPIARFDLSPASVSPTVSVLVSLDAGTVLRAIEHCNLHGLWAFDLTL
jgi:superoxide reductase